MSYVLSADRLELNNNCTCFILYAVHVDVLKVFNYAGVLDIPGHHFVNGMNFVWYSHVHSAHANQGLLQ